MDSGDWPGIEYAPGKVIVGRSPAMKRVFFQLNQYAPSSAPVLIAGDTGTGKELVAQAIHYHSGRTGRFVAVNCASVSDSLFESEFFGHRRGAFTGALADRAGWFELADGGTLFLDEVGDMPLAQQAKLLRTIEDNAVVPVGASAPIAVDVRIVAATNVDLHRSVEQGSFRRDLLDRLEVLTLRLPPLRERPEDIPLLVDHLFAVANEAEGTHVPAPGADIRRRIVLACGSGSIRVLKNAIRRLVVVKRRGRIGLPDLQAAGIVASASEDSCAATVEPDADPRRMRLDVEFDRGMAFREIMAHVGKAVTDAALRANDGSAPAAAEELGMAKSTWYRVRRR